MNKIRSLAQRTALVTATVGVIVLGVVGPGTASAAPVTAPAVAAIAAAPADRGVFEAYYNLDGSVTVQKVTDTAAGPSAQWSRTFKFNNAQTKRIYDAALVGATGVISGLCTIAAPSIVDPFCGVIAGLLAAIVRGFSAPGDNDCLGVTVTTRLGWPPVSVRAGYRDCN